MWDTAVARGVWSWPPSLLLSLQEQEIMAKLQAFSVLSTGTTFLWEAVAPRVVKSPALEPSCRASNPAHVHPTCLNLDRLLRAGYSRKNIQLGIVLRGFTSWLFHLLALVTSGEILKLSDLYSFLVHETGMIIVLLTELLQGRQQFIYVRCLASLTQGEYSVNVS